MTKEVKVFIVNGECWSGGGLGSSFCQGTEETIKQCNQCLRYLPDKDKRK